jgi:hypothetical protein
MNLQPQEFQEWMVTQALAEYLGKLGTENPERMAWLFGLVAETPRGSRKLSDLCGFDWVAGRVSGGAEQSLKEADRGNLSLDDFKKTFLMITPDFRYLTERRDKQLIIEAKGTPRPIGRRDDDQARRYFLYLRDSGHTGAVVYLAPNPKLWLKWLTEKIAVGYAIPFGVLDMNTQIIPKVADELVHVVGKALVQSAHLLEEAMRLSKTA